MKRPNSINSILMDDDNTCFYDNSGKEHVQYSYSGFDQTEYDIYNSNGWINNIKEKVPNYKDSDLQQNTYKLYYKPYSLWTKDCQSVYSTSDVAAVGDQVGLLSTGFFVLFVTSVVLYGVMFLNLIFSSSFGRSGQPIGYLMILVFILLETIGFIVLIIMYCIAFQTLRTVDRKQLNYYSAMECSDSVLQNAID